MGRIEWAESQWAESQWAQCKWAESQWAQLHWAESSGPNLSGLNRTGPKFIVTGFLNRFTKTFIGTHILSLGIFIILQVDLGLNVAHKFISKQQLLKSHSH